MLTECHDFIWIPIFMDRWPMMTIPKVYNPTYDGQHADPGVHTHWSQALVAGTNKLQLTSGINNV